MEEINYSDRGTKNKAEQEIGNSGDMLLSVTESR